VRTCTRQIAKNHSLVDHNLSEQTIHDYIEHCCAYASTIAGGRKPRWVLQYLQIDQSASHSPRTSHTSTTTHTSIPTPNPRPTHTLTHTHTRDALDAATAQDAHVLRHAPRNAQRHAAPSSLNTPSPSPPPRQPPTASPPAAAPPPHEPPPHQTSPKIIRGSSRSSPAPTPVRALPPTSPPHVLAQPPTREPSAVHSVLVDNASGAEALTCDANVTHTHTHAHTLPLHHAGASRGFVGLQVFRVHVSMSLSACLRACLY